MKYVVVSGGVLSGLGKGITASSIGVLLQAAGYNVTAIKIDPYLNCDAGRMSPYEHGEVYVLKDGSEVDLDLGNYERFLDITLTHRHNITTGKVFAEVIMREKEGQYLGKTLQVVPHITDEIKSRIETAARLPVSSGGNGDGGIRLSDGPQPTPDVCIIELGGTVGDMESAPFVEALRQFQTKVGRENMCFVHVSLVPVVGSVGEQKTKPTQQSVRNLMGLGIVPDMLVCRSTEPISQGVRTKLSQACAIAPSRILAAFDVADIYAVPGLLEVQEATHTICTVLGLPEPDQTEVRKYLGNWLPDIPPELAPKLTVAIVGKYVGLLDSYLSLARAIGHAAHLIGVHTEISWVDAETLNYADSTSYHPLLQSDCIIVPGGFGDRGVEGKILACRVGRENSIPTLGICLGMQTMLCDYWRNVLMIPEAVIGEVEGDEAKPILKQMPELKLGSSVVTLCTPPPSEGVNYVRPSKYNRCHKTARNVHERFRHRYALETGRLGRISYEKGVERQLREVGYTHTGIDQHCAAVELDQHPFYVGVQYHPEFTSRVNRPGPLFVGLLEAAAQNKSAAMREQDGL